MLKSRFAKKEGFRAQKTFTDRIEPRTVFSESICSFSKRPREIVVYYGKGGIGKSSLLKRLAREEWPGEAYLAGKQLRAITVSLDAYEYANPVNVLSAIRAGIKGNCELFDYALAQYWAKTRMTPMELASKGNFLDSPIMGIINEALDLGSASLCIPTTVLKKALEVLKESRFKRRHSEEINEIAGLNEFELFERLPHYLGLCFSALAEDGVVHALFLDSYESLLGRTGGETPSTDREAWLQELFLSSDTIRMYIASRDRLKWDRMDPEWGEYLHQHLLDNLSDEDSRWFLGQVPIGEPEAMERIVRDAGGVPLFLDMCVDMYERERNGPGGARAWDRIRMGGAVMERYIRHLNEKEKHAVGILSVPRCFTVGMARDLLAREGLPFSEEELEELFEKSIFRKLAGDEGLWGLDGSVRRHLALHTTPQRLAAVVRSAMAVAGERGTSEYYPFLATALDYAMRHPQGPWREIIGDFFRVSDAYANAGYWKELHELFEAGPKEDVHPSIRALRDYLELIWLRRTGQLRLADKRAESVDGAKEDIGVWHYLVRYLKAQIRHLLGHYDESLAEYRKLLDEMAPLRGSLPPHVTIQVGLKHADILMLKGEFKAACREVDEILDTGELDAADRIELLRVKGHAYRFQGLFREAETVYQSALNIAERARRWAYVAKLHTNLAETLCERDPAAALLWAEKAKKRHELDENGVELCKTLAAESVARAASGEVECGVFLAKQAMGMAEKCGYRSGCAFGLWALMRIAGKYGGDGDMVSIRMELKRLVGDLGVYRFLLDDVEAGAVP